MKVFDSHGREIELITPLLDSGREGKIARVRGRPDLVAKIAHKPPNHFKSKLSILRTVVPSETKEYAFSAPVTLLYSDRQGRACVGYLMKLSLGTPLYAVFRELLSGARSPENGLAIARNFVRAIAAIHSAGALVGDINERNILVEGERVVIIDTDSFQVRSGGQTFRCGVGSVDFTPPELQKARFPDVDRQPHSDYFGMGTVLFGLLMRGHYPFAGGYLGRGAQPTRGEKIARGLFSHTPGGLPLYAPQKTSPPFAKIPAEIQSLFLKCFESGHREPTLRPAPAEWLAALDRVKSSDLAGLTLPSPGAVASARFRLTASGLADALRKTIAAMRRPAFALTALSLATGIGLFLAAGSPAPVNKDAFPFSDPNPQISDNANPSGFTTPRLWRLLRGDPNPNPPLQGE